MSFRELGLHRLIVENLHAMGYRQPRPIQAQAIGPILQGRDLIGLAQTGTGKTCAFAAPVSHLLLEHRPDRDGAQEGGALNSPFATSSKRKQRPAGSNPAMRLRALLLCPTRELAQQVEAETASIIRGTVLRSAVAFGKVGMTPQAEEIARGVDVLVATPGRVLELLEAGALTLRWLRHVVIDEADRMLDIGFLPQVSSILGHATSATHHQTILFTATMPPAVERLAGQFLKQAVRIEIGQHTTAVAHVQQRVLQVADRNKIALLLQLIKDEQRRGVLIFCATRRRVGWVGAALKRHGLNIGMIHGDRTQPQRLRALQKFTKGEHDVLVATDVAARGLHIEAVRTVINYDLPQQPEEYVHRIGRAGHGGGFGEAFTLLDQRHVDLWNAVRDTCQVDVQPEVVPGFSERSARPREHAAASGASQVSAAASKQGRSGNSGKSKRNRREEPLVKRGRIKRRQSRRKPIAGDEKPGRGVV